MPFARCPVCHDSFHLAIRSDPKEWERQHVRERAEDGTPLLKCIRCWVELKPGHQVTVRSLPLGFQGNLSIGQRGVVEAGASEDGSRVTVRFGQALVAFEREQLFYVVGQESAA
jgi:hypothetical protein